MKTLGTISPKSIEDDDVPDKTVRADAKPLPDELTTLQPVHVAAALLFPLESGQPVAVIVFGANHAYNESGLKPDVVPRGQDAQSSDESCKDADVPWSVLNLPEGQRVQDPDRKDAA